MRRHHLLLYVIAFAVVVGVAFTDLSTTTLLYALMILACPLMMILMMRGMHGERGDIQQDSADHPDHPDHPDHADRDHDHPAGQGRP